MDDYDLYELIRYLYIIGEDALADEIDNIEEYELEDWLYSAYEITFDNFKALIRNLLPLCTIAKSPLTNQLYRGFGVGNTWLIKEEIK